MSLPILHVIGGGDTGGAMGNVLPLVQALRKEGERAHLLCLGEGGLAARARALGLDPLVLPMTNPWDPRILPTLRRILRGGPQALSPEALTEACTPWAVVHSHGMRANLPVRMVALTMAARPCLITTVHSDLRLDYARHLQAAAYKYLDRITWPLVDRQIAVSEGLRSHLIERGWPREKTAVVPSGVEIEPAAGESTQGRSGSPARDGRPTIGTVARLVAVKDLELLLDAASILLPQVPRLRVVIVGDGPEAARLRAGTVERGLADVVHFTGELRPVQPALETFDAYVLTSRSEGLPVSVLEAMACALPVVGTRVGGLPEVVEDGVTGFLVPRTASREETAVALAERLGRLLQDERLRRRMGEAGATMVARKFSSRAAALRMVRVYQRCALEKAGRENGRC